MEHNIEPDDHEAYRNECEQPSMIVRVVFLKHGANLDESRKDEREQCNVVNKFKPLHTDQQRERAVIHRHL